MCVDEFESTTDFTSLGEYQMVSLVGLVPKGVSEDSLDLGLGARPLIGLSCIPISSDDLGLGVIDSMSIERFLARPEPADSGDKSMADIGNLVSARVGDLSSRIWEENG